MYAETEFRQASHALRCVLERRSARHQRRRTQHAHLDTLFHRLIDAHMATEIIGIDDHPLQYFLTSISYRTDFLSFIHLDYTARRRYFANGRESQAKVEYRNI